MSGHSKWSTIKRQKGVADTRHAHPGTDIRAVLDGYVSISPLDIAMVHEAHTRRLQSAAEALSSHLAEQA